MSGRKKRRPQRSRRHPRARRAHYPYEDWPAFKRVPGTDGRLMGLDLDELTPEQRAEWDRQTAEGKRLRELHERFAKKMAHRTAVRDGLLPPPWMKPSNPKPGSAAAWIDTVCPNGEWRLKSAKAIWREIKACDPEGPSYRAVARELKMRR